MIASGGGEGGGGTGDLGPVLAIAGGVLGSFLGASAGGLKGTGIRAALGMQQLLARRQLQATRAADQWNRANAAAQKMPGGRVVSQSPITPQIAKLATALGKYQAAVEAKKAAKKNAKFEQYKAKQTARAYTNAVANAGGPSYFAVAGYGPNNGPPIVGSADYMALTGGGY